MYKDWRKIRLREPLYDLQTLRAATRATTPAHYTNTPWSSSNPSRPLWRSFDRLLTWCRGQQLLHVHRTQRTDSARVLAAVRALNRIGLVGETMHWPTGQTAIRGGSCRFVARLELRTPARAARRRAVERCRRHRAMGIALVRGRGAGR